MTSAPARPDLKPPHRILVIDDNDSIHGDFRKTLAGGHAAPGPDLAADEALIFGETRAQADMPQFEIDSASQGQEGLERVQSALRDGRPYAMAFVDMRMPPGWDGVQTIEQLWKTDPDLQVVICTAYSDYSWEQITRRLGASDRLLILKKPFDDIEVCQLAAAMTEKWSLSRQARLKLAELEQIAERRTAQLRYAAMHDRLTGLANRDFFTERLDRTLAAARSDPQRKFAVLFLDFDRFKIINDSLGHEMGDLLLIAIAERLKGTVRGDDAAAAGEGDGCVARLGGDEFIILLDHLRELDDATAVAQRLLQNLSAPYTLKGHTVRNTVSIGITTSAGGYQTPEQVIRDADNAMYRAKAAGKARYVLFDQQMHREAMERLTMENELRQALASNTLDLVYQPIISLNSGDVTGFEALLRWNHPDLGSIPPLQFIPLAEEIGEIVPIGAWVLREAAAQLVRWRHHPVMRQLSISINLSRRQLASPELVGQIRDVLNTTGVNPACLKLEITESAIMEDTDNAIRVLGQIRALGIRLLMDDFGTAYSSLSCLHRFPLNGLKIDRAFINNVGERRDYAAVVNAIVTLAHNLDIELVAEGVETADQVAMLQALGCDLAQGFYFARALPTEQAELFVATRASSRAAA